MIQPGQVSTRAFDPTLDRFPRETHPVVRRVLVARGVVSPEDASLNLNHALPPEGLGGLEDASDRLAGAVRNHEKILIAGDFDADGATGTALAVLALRAMGATRVDFRVPDRFEFGYGLTAQLVDAIAADRPDLIVTVDSGICCNAGVARARELGFDVLVTDHHLPGEVLPDATAIVNPNLENDPFPSKCLAGVGVMFYLLAAVRKRLRADGWFGGRRAEPRLADWLDLVALGTVADLVPLDRNNRILVKGGLDRIRRGSTRPGLMALMRLAKRDYRHATASDLGFALGPRINAAGRLEDMSVGIQCLISEDPAGALSLAQQLDDLNRERRDIQESMQAQAFSLVSDMLSKLSGQSLPSALCLHEPGWHQGVVGLVASRIKDAVHRPVIAFAPESEDSSLLKGSARSIRGLHIRDVLARVDALHPQVLRSFGGHAMAAGLSLRHENLNRFRTAFEHAVDEFLADVDLRKEVMTDGVLDADDLNLSLAQMLEDLGPWGQRFPEPLFDGRFEVMDHRIVGERHLKMKLRPCAGGAPLDAIAFGKLPEDLERACGQRGMGATARMLYRLDVNRWRDTERCQLVIEDFVDSAGSGE